MNNLIRVLVICCSFSIFSQNITSLGTDNFSETALDLDVRTGITNSANENALHRTHPKTIIEAFRSGTPLNLSSKLVVREFAHTRIPQSSLEINTDLFLDHDIKQQTFISEWLYSFSDIVHRDAQTTHKNEINSNNKILSGSNASSSALFWFDKNEDESYTARHECSFVQAGDKFYLLGGRENAKTLDIYDYSNDTWNSLVNSAPVEFNHFQALEYEGLIWVIGAFKTNNFPNEQPADYIWAFNPATQEWIQGPEIPNDRKRGSAGLSVHNGKFYILAGNTEGHDGGYVKWFDEYDPSTGIWTELDDAPRPRDHFHSVVINGKLYAASGRLTGGNGGIFGPVISEVDVFDFTTESWNTLPSAQNIPTPRAAAIVANFENKLIVAGGESSANTSAYDITEIYDPATQTWSEGASLNFKRHGTQGIVSGDGIVVAGGSPKRGGGNQKNMEFYGQDNPMGFASEESVLSSDPLVGFAIGQTRTISLTNNEGNIGTLIKNLSLSGPDANEFTIDSGDVPYKLIKANSIHDIVITYLGNGDETNATLTINYNNSESLVVNLINSPLITPTDQISLIGDVISLPIEVIDNSNSYTFTASNLPEGLDIDATTGVISGTVTGSVLNSPYTSRVAIVDVLTSLEVSFVNFRWLVVEPTILPWIEDFEDLADGSTSDAGVTAWSTLIDQGVLDVNSGLLSLSSVEGGSVAFWNSEPIAIIGYENITISIDVNDLDSTKENSDYVTVYYKLDGGSLIPFGTVNGNIGLTTFTVSGLTGTVLELVVETQVSWSGETYTIDNVNVSGISTNPIAVSSVTLSPSILTVEIGDTSQQLIATVNPINADDTSVTWSSSDETIVTVDQNGFVTPIALGTATITVTTTDGGFEAESLVTVIEEVIIPVTGITLSPPSATMNIGGSPLQLVATIIPSDASDQGVLWSSSDSSVASVNANGEVIANTVGIALITATSADGGFVASSTINVIAAPIDLPWIEDFQDLADGSTVDTGVTAWTTAIDQGDLEVNGGLLLLTSVEGGSTAFWNSEPISIIGHDNVTISIDVDDLDSTKESNDFVTVYYKLDGGSLIPFGTVNGNIGLTTLTVSGLSGTVLELVVETQVSWSGETYTIDNVNVSGTPTNPIAVSSVTLSPSTLMVEMGDTSQQLTATVNPINADDTSVTWSSSDETIVTVDQNGFVTPIALGTATITVTTTDGGFEAESLVTVIEEVIIPVTGISLNPPSAIMNIGGSPLQLVATILPSDASDQGVLWSSSDNSVASVNANGEVMANTEGAAVITATSADGGFVASSTIKVIAAPIDLPWIEDFEDLADGSTVDTGVTAWTTAIDQGNLEVNGGLLLLTSVSGGSTAFWNSEAISITGHDNVTISIDVDDLDSTKESNDFVTVYYKLDGGALIPFGTVNGNIGLTTLTVSGLMGTVLELVVETQVSWSGETYTIDNVNVSDIIAQKALIPSTAIVQETSKDDYVIYPNPTSQVLNIRTSANHNIDFIQVFDATGRLVRTYNKNVIPQGSTTIQLVLDGLQTGMYSLHIMDSQSNRFIKKLLVK